MIQNLRPKIYLYLLFFFTCFIALKWMYSWKLYMVTKKHIVSPSREKRLQLIELSNMDLKHKFRSAQKIAIEKTFTILIWAPKHNPQKLPNQTNDYTCGRCSITSNKSKINDQDTKAVLFYYQTVDLNDMPQNRRRDQLYIWICSEAPPSLSRRDNLDLRQYDGIFNLTGTHRRYSDVYFSYGATSSVWRKLKLKSFGDFHKYMQELIANKTGLACWLVSNCNFTIGAQRRMNLSNDLLLEGLALDREGKCFPNSSLTDVEQARKYKFYMSFENNYHCDDYITEKFFKNALLYESVPVVWGAKKSDYEAVAPPGSFIFVEDFATPAKLVEYLNYLDKNDTAYKEYFHWRTMKVEDMPQHDRRYGICQVCRILHGINVDNLYNPRYKKLYSDIPLFGYPNRTRQVSSLHQFYYEQEDRSCFPHFE